MAALLVGMVLTAMVLVYMPQAKRLGELRMTVATKRADLEAKSKQAMVVPDFLRHIKALRRRYSDFHSRLPQRKELGGFLEEISRLLARENLTTKHFQSGTPSREELFNTLPINMKLTGSYRSLGKLLTSINQMKRFTRVQKLLLVKRHGGENSRSNTNDADDQLEIDLQLNIYFITESQNGA